MNSERSHSIAKSHHQQQQQEHHELFSSTTVELNNSDSDEEQMIISLCLLDDGNEDNNRDIGATSSISDTIKNDSCCSRRDWRILVFGQGIALSLACCSISSAQLQNMNGIAHMPLFQVSFGYFFLQIHFYFMKKNNVRIVHNVGQVFESMMNSDSKDCCHESSSLLMTSPYRTKKGKKKKKKETAYFWNMELQSSWYYYALVAFLDVQANYFVVLSFRYTAVIHSTILTSISIISVMASSRLILGKTFQIRHFVGAILCVIGASCVMSLDVALPKSSRNHNRGSSSSVHDDTILAESGTFIGDSFALIAALLFGLNDCLAEYTIQNSTPDEYLAMMGVFGFLFSFCESIILERNQLQHFCCMILKHDGCHEIQYSKDSLYPTTTTLLEDKNDDDDDNADVNLLAIFTLWAWYIATFYTFYASASRFLRIADATLLSLSLQTSNLWTMIFSVMVQDFALSPFFLCSSAIILFGVWLYERGPPPTVTGF